MARRNYIDNSPSVTLTGTIDNSVITFGVSSLVGFPTARPFTVTVDRGTASAEQMLVTNVVGLTVTVTRSSNGLGAFPHTIGAAFEHTANAVDFDEANGHVNAASNVHGITSAVVGTNDTQTLTNKTLATPIITGTLAGTLLLTALTASGIGEVGRLIVDTMVTLPSATPGVQFGAQGGFNLQASGRAIQAMNNAVVSDLNLNAAGGNVVIGGTGSAITIGTGTTTTTLGGTLNAGRLISSAAFASLPNATPNLQIGAQASANMQFNNSDIQAVNNAVASNLNLNPAGGTVNVGGPAITSSTLQVGANGAARFVIDPVAATIRAFTAGGANTGFGLATSGGNVTIGDTTSTTTVAGVIANRGVAFQYANQAALPGSGTDGQLAVTLDKKQLWVWNNSTTAWLPANGVPVAPSVSSTTSAVTSGATEMKDATTADLVVTNAVAGRRYRIVTSGGSIQGGTAGDRFAIRFRDGGASSPTSGSTLCGHDSTKIVNSGSETFFAETTYVATASTMTIGIFLARLAGTGTASLTGTRELYIQDIGAL